MKVKEETEKVGLKLNIQKTKIMASGPITSWQSEVAQLCLTHCDPMDCSLPGSSVHGILQARILEWVATSFSRVSFPLKDPTWVSCIASRHFTFWATREAQIDGETVTDFIFGGSKITADGERNHEIKRHFLLGRKIMTNLDSILKSRDITLLTNVRLVEAMFVVVVVFHLFLLVGG